MIDRLQMNKDVLALIDSNPMNKVEINGLIEKYSKGADGLGKRQVRTSLQEIIRKFELTGEIDFVDYNVRHITFYSAQIPLSNGGFIRGSWQREKERQKELENVNIIPAHYYDNSIKIDNSNNVAVAVHGGINKNNDENTESKKNAEESLVWTKRNVLVAIIAIAVTIAIFLLSK